jgi:hypothetical protein
MAEVDVGERLEEGLKSELERSASGVWASRSSLMVQLSRGTTGGGRHRRCARGGRRTRRRLVQNQGGRWLEEVSFLEEGLRRTRVEARGGLTWRLTSNI